MLDKEKSGRFRSTKISRTGDTFMRCFSVQCVNLQQCLRVFLAFLLLASAWQSGYLRAETKADESGKATNEDLQQEEIQDAAIRTAREIERIAKRKRLATESVELYEDFLAQDDLDPEEREKAEEKLPTWKKRAEEKRIRWGIRWTTIEAIRERLKVEEQALRVAHRHIEVKADKEARRKLEDASRSNPEGIRGDFYLGILHALIGRHSSSAEDCFSECVRRLTRASDSLRGVRRANLIAALNNRAICRARMGEHAKAMRDWNEAISLAPTTPELVQNLGYYATLANIVQDWGVSRRNAQRIAELYANLAVANESAAFQENVGWLFIPYVDAAIRPEFAVVKLAKNDPDEELLDDLTGEADSDLRVVDWCTGFAVDDQYVLTASSVVAGAYGLRIHSQGERRRDFPGKIVAFSDDRSLALVRFRGLQATVLPLSQAESTRATDFCTIYFPTPGFLGKEPIVQSGTVIDIKTSSSGEGYVTRLVHDVQLTPGSEGAPLLGLDGHILGINLGESDMLTNAIGYLSAISSSDIRAFLATTGIEFPALEGGHIEPVGNIGKFAKMAADTTVYRIAVIGRVPRLSWTERIGEIRGIRTKAGWNAYEDPWCIRCDGRGEVACQKRECRGGYISYNETVIIGKLQGVGDPIRRTVSRKVKCTICDGDGLVQCPHCHGRQVEPLIR